MSRYKIHTPTAAGNAHAERAARAVDFINDKCAILIVADPTSGAALEASALVHQAAAVLRRVQDRAANPFSGHTPTSTQVWGLTRPLTRITNRVYTLVAQHEAMMRAFKGDKR